MSCGLDDSRTQYLNMGWSIFSVYLTGEEADGIEFTFVLYHRLLLLFVLFVLSSCFFAVWRFYFGGTVWIMDYFYCVPATLAGAMIFYAVEVYRDLKNASKNKHV